MLSSLTLSTLNEMSAYYSIVYTPFRRLLVKLDHFSGFVYIRHEAWTTVVPAPAMSVCLSSGERPAPSVTRKWGVIQIVSDNLLSGSGGSLCSRIFS